MGRLGRRLCVGAKRRSAFQHFCPPKFGRIEPRLVMVPALELAGFAVAITRCLSRDGTRPQQQLRKEQTAFARRKHALPQSFMQYDRTLTTPPWSLTSLCSFPYPSHRHRGKRVAFGLLPSAHRSSRSLLLHRKDARPR